MTTLAPGDFLQVNNTSNQSITLGWDSREYVLTPGSQKPVPMEAVINAFGDPRAMDVVHTVRFGGPDSPPAFIADRTSEVRRLRQRWGIHDGPESSFENAEGKAMVPSVEVYTLDGQRLYTVVDDPAGNKSAPVTPSSSNTTLEDLLARQQQQIDFLKAQLDVLNSSTETPAEDTAEIDPGDESNLNEQPVEELPPDQ